MGAPTDAGFGAEGSHVTGAVADDGESFLGDRSEYQLSHFPVGQDFSRLRVDHFGDKMVFENVESVSPLEALDGNPWADDFAQPVDVEGIEVELSLDFVAHVL